MREESFFVNMFRTYILCITPTRALRPGVRNEGNTQAKGLRILFWFVNPGASHEGVRMAQPPPAVKRDQVRIPDRGWSRQGARITNHGNVDVNKFRSLHGRKGAKPLGSSLLLAGFSSHHTEVFFLY